MRQAEFAWLPDSAPVPVFLYHPLTLNKAEPMTCFQPTQYAKGGRIVIPTVALHPTVEPAGAEESLESLHHEGVQTWPSVHMFKC